MVKYRCLAEAIVEIVLFLEFLNGYALYKRVLGIVDLIVGFGKVFKRSISKLSIFRPRIGGVAFCAFILVRVYGVIGDGGFGYEWRELGGLFPRHELIEIPEIIFFIVSIEN